MTGLFSYQFRYLEVDSNIVDALPKDDSIVQLFKDVGKRFGGNELGMVVIETDNVFEPGVLQNIQQVTDTLAEIDGVLSVTSLTNMVNFKVEGDNFEVSNLIHHNNWPETKSDVDKLKKEIISNDMVAGKIVSKDGTATIIIFTFQDEADINSVAAEVVGKIEKLGLPEKYYFAGVPFFTKYVADVISVDLIKLIPISFLLIALILFLSFHSIRGIILPLLTAGLAIVWAIGSFVLMGLNLSMVSNNVPIIILAVGSAYAIHVLNRVNQCKEKDPKKAIAKALPLIIVPVVLTALTTMVGFLAFIFGAYLSMIRDFGLLAALGTSYSAFMALIFVPALLAVIPPKRKDAKGGVLSGDRKSYLNDHILIPLYKLNTKFPYHVLTVWIILFIIGISGIFMIKRSVSVSDYFKPNHPASIATHIMEEKFGGSKPVFVVFKGDIQSPEVLNSMIDIADYMKQSPYVTITQSIADIVLKLNGALSGEEKIPDDQAKIEQLWFILDQQGGLSQLVTEDLDQGIIIAKFNNKGEKEAAQFNKYMQTYFNAHRSDNYTVEITGMPYVNVQLDKSLVRSQITSLFIAIILVITIVSLWFRSFAEGFYAGLPIVATIAILYGLMGLTGIPLNVVTVLVASVAMGIGIDYSIHFISHFNHSVKKYQNINKAIEETMLISGKAIMINFISVSAGFLVLVFSELLPMIYFGALIAFSMLGSSMGALTLLPVTLLIGNKKLKPRKV